MKVKLHKEFRPYTIFIESSKDHQDLLIMLRAGLGKYNQHTVGYSDVERFISELIKTQVGGDV